MTLSKPSDNLILLQSAAKFRNTETELMVAPEIPEELYNNFIAELDESLQKKVKKETPICQADHSMLFKKGKKGFLLTSESLYYHNGSTEWMIKLSDIIEVDSDKKSLTVECADDQSFDIEGDGAEELGKMLKQLINWK